MINPRWTIQLTAPFSTFCVCTAYFYKLNILFTYMKIKPNLLIYCPETDTARSATRSQTKCTFNSLILRHRKRQVDREEPKSKTRYICFYSKIPAKLSLRQLISRTANACSVNLSVKVRLRNGLCCRKLRLLFLVGKGYF